jgi:hypothetical protein
MVINEEYNHNQHSQWMRQAGYRFTQGMIIHYTLLLRGQDFMLDSFQRIKLIFLPSIAQPHCPSEKIDREFPVILRG